MKVRLAVSAGARLRGLNALAGSDVLLLAPCRDIHTVGMARPIDIAFLDAKGSVVRAERGVPPGTRRRCSGAVAVLERYEAAEAWFDAGDEVDIGIAGGFAVGNECARGN